MLDRPYSKIRGGAWETHRIRLLTRHSPSIFNFLVVFRLRKDLHGLLEVVTFKVFFLQVKSLKYYNSNFEFDNFPFI